MKLVAVTVLVALGVALLACGGTNPNTATAQSTESGTWQALLQDGTGNAAALSFVTTFTVSQDGALTNIDIEFLTDNPCFTIGNSANGSMSVTVSASGLSTGTLNNFTVLSGTPSGNTLNLNGTVDGNVITGTWTLAGSSGCTYPPSGSTTNPPFTMCQGTGVCTPTTK
jgi:hypothetical protein